MQDNHPVSQVYPYQRILGLKRLGNYGRRPNTSPAKRGAGGHRLYTGEDQEFLKICARLNINEPTRRQYSRWCQRRGMVWRERYAMAVAGLASGR